MKSIGIIGGFGGYATLDFFRRLLKKFEGESERSFPHIIMDNDFQMPSRTKAILTGEGYEEIVKAIADSIKRMLYCEVDYIILVCGNAHNFLPDVYDIVPQAKEKVISLPEIVGLFLQQKNKKRVLVLASEGSLLKHLYSNVLKKYGIECIEPDISEFNNLRYFIEIVKNNQNNDGKEFVNYIAKYEINDVILGCTEFPVLINSVKDKKSIPFEIYDPLEILLDYLKIHVKLS